jgi:hypothetical protein
MRRAGRRRGWSHDLRQRLFKTGGRLIRHARYFVLQLAESYLTGCLFRQILQSIDWRGTRYDREPSGLKAIVIGDSAGVSLNATVGVTNPGNGGAQSPRVAQMTAVDVLGRVDELTDEVGRLHGRRHGGGNRAISQIPANKNTYAFG